MRQRGQRIDQRGELLERSTAAFQCREVRHSLDHRELTASQLLGDQGDRVKRFCSDLALRLVDDTGKAHVVVVVVDQLQIRHRIANFLAVGKARATQNAVRNCRACKCLLDAVCLRVGAVKHRKIAVGRLPRRHRAVDRVHHEARLHVLVVAELQMDLLAFSCRRPKGLPLAPRVVRDHGVCRIQNGLRGAVILLQLDRFCLGKSLVKGENILNGGTAELVDALVVVAHHHEVLIEARQQDGELQLRHVGVLKLVHAHVFEAFLIRLAHIGVIFEQQYRLHDDVVKIQRVGFAQDLLIRLVHARGLLQAVVVPHLHGIGIGGHQLVLGAADLVHHRLNGQQLFVDVTALHGKQNRFLRVVGVVDRKTRAVAALIAMLAQDPHANRVERTRPDLRGGCGVLGEHFGKTLLDLVCRLVGKGDRQNTVWLTGVVGELGQNPKFNIGRRKRQRVFQVPHTPFVHAVRDVIAEIGVSVADDKRDAAHQHGGFSAPRARKHQQRMIDREYRLALTLVK